MAIISPSWGGPSLFPEIYELGLNNLCELFGLIAVQFPTARMQDTLLHSSPESRARDLNAAFANKDVAAIIATIGGEDSVRLLPCLDLEIIRQNPKILMGFSDTSSLLAYLNMELGLVTFYGPSIMAGFAQMKQLPAEFSDHVRTVLMGHPGDQVSYKAFASWTDGYPDWGGPGRQGATNPLKINTEGWRWLQGTGKVQGRLFGGCFETLDQLKGTRFWPREPGFWNSRILFLELSEMRSSLHQLRFSLRNYGMQGVFESISALLVGRILINSLAEQEEFYEQLLSLINDEFGKLDLIVVANMDFGHSVIQWVLPYGCLAEVDVANQSFGLCESPFCN